MLTLRWLKAKGGVAAIQRENEAKSTCFAEVDRNAYRSQGMPNPTAALTSM